MSNVKFKFFISIFSGVLIAFIILPIALTLIRQTFDINALFTIIKDEQFLEALKNSILTSTATAIISLIFGVPLGYALAREEFRGKSLVQGIVDVPVVIPHSVVGIILLLTFSSYILDNYLGIILAMLFVSSPFTINSARDGFLAIDEKIEHVARTLGATRFKVFVTISLPLAFRSIISGAILTWARAISEVGAILVVAYYPKTAQILVIEYFNNYGLRLAMPIATVMIVMSLTMFALLRWLSAKA